MKRKVIQLAGKTLVVSLPNRWARLHGIEKGDELELEEDEEKILIKTLRAVDTPRKVKLDLSKTNKDIVRSIVAILHKEGYDEIDINYGTHDRFEIIRDTVNGMLIGYEIIDQTRNRVLIKNLIMKDHTDLDSLIQRNFNIGVSMATELMQAIETNDQDKLKEIENMEETNNKLTNISQRILNQQEYKSIQKCFLYTALWNYENICDDLKRICKRLGTMKTISITKRTMEIFRMTATNIDMIRKVYYNYSYDLLEEFCTKCQDTLKSIEDSKTDQEITNILYNINRTLKNLNGTITGLNYEITLSPEL